MRVTTSCWIDSMNPAVRFQSLTSSVPRSNPTWSRSRTCVTYQSSKSKGGEHMTVTIVPNDKGNPPGKLADAELHFQDGPLQGLKLIGFGIWERRTGNGRNVTFPSRQYSVNGERRSFALLRPVVDVQAQESVRDLILEAYREFEEQETH